MREDEIISGNFLEFIERFTLFRIVEKSRII